MQKACQHTHTYMHNYLTATVLCLEHVRHVYYAEVCMPAFSILKMLTKTYLCVYLHISRFVIAARTDQEAVLIPTPAHTQTNTNAQGMDICLLKLGRSGKWKIHYAIWKFL